MIVLVDCLTKPKPMSLGSDGIDSSMVKGGGDLRSNFYIRPKKREGGDDEESGVKE